MALLLKGFTDHTINTGEVEIGYSVGPDNGPTLLLLHGATSRRDSLFSGHRLANAQLQGDRHRPARSR